MFSAIQITAFVSFLLGKPIVERRPKGPKIKPEKNQSNPLYPFSPAMVEVIKAQIRNTKGTNVLKTLSKIFVITSLDIAKALNGPELVMLT